MHGGIYIDRQTIPISIEIEIYRQYLVKFCDMKSH